MDAYTSLTLYLFYVFVAALFFSAVDERYKWSRMGRFYREDTWLNFLFNYVVIAIISAAFDFLP
ncbi:hypothetical protein IPL68_00575 [Candidatus Saccharibacteria bacterium]|nr:MAG: hypothetical protein IPL68_00575 [Candidatus Saccharibacteria bacterium]